MVCTSAPSLPIEVRLGERETGNNGIGRNPLPQGFLAYQREQMLSAINRGRLKGNQNLMYM